MWESFRVDSIHAYGDYDESCIFAYAVGKVIESFYHFYKLENKKVAALFNEWMLGMGALYIKKQLPAVATLFTTHATSIGRSIAGTMMKATTSRWSLPEVRTRFIASIKTSIPLLRYS